MLLSRHQNAGKSHDIKIADRFFENMAQIKYLGTTVTNQNRFRRKLRDEIGVMLATIQSRNFCLLVCCIKA
jgi:hypothetical protein